MKKAEIFRGTAYAENRHVQYQMERCPGRRRTILYNSGKLKSLVVPDLSFLWLHEIGNFHVLVETPEGLKSYQTPNTSPALAGYTCLSGALKLKITQDFINRKLSLSEIFWGSSFYQYDIDDDAWWQTVSFDSVASSYYHYKKHYPFVFDAVDAVFADVKKQEK